MIPGIPQNPETLIPAGKRDAVATALPSLPDLATLPRRVDRRGGAALVTAHYFPTSPRTLEVWPLTWRRVNGKAVCETAELFAVAQAKLDAAPPIRGGRHAKPDAA